MTDPKQILKRSKTILLVDWPDTTVPRTLLEAGFIVFGYSPNCYARAEIVAHLPEGIDSKNIFPPKNGNESGYLIFRRLDKPPADVDIVSIYRPADELPGIITEHVLPLGAKTVWFQRPEASSEEQSMVEKHNLIFIGDSDIAAIARTL